MAQSAMAMGLDLRLCTARTVGGFVREASAIDGGDGRMVARLEESVKSLESERKKIEAFKRELPLCMNLISDVIEELKKELERWQGQEFSGFLGEFVAKESKCVETKADCGEKMNWLSSAQLWNDNSDDLTRQSNKIENKNVDERNRSSDRKLETKKVFSNSKPQSRAATFLPFKGLSVLSPVSKESTVVPAVALPELSLAGPAAKAKERIDDNSTHVFGFKYISTPLVSTPLPVNFQTQQQNQRKTRRCWSQELHRRFLGALEELGGHQVATPKQIREVMRVDGLTNDEVKSHLQKYRLHTRRTPNSSAYVNLPVTVVEGLWASTEKSTLISPRHSVSQSGSPSSPLHLSLSDRAISTTGGDSYEDEDGKSEDCSWK